MPIQLIQNCHNKEGILSLLSELTAAPPISDSKYNDIIDIIKNNYSHNIFVYTIDSVPIGMITTIIEQKIIHGGKCVAHIEDLVISKKYRGQGIATELINYVVDYAKAQSCYKIILDCKKELIPFYNKNNFKEECVQMRMDILK